MDSRISKQTIEKTKSVKLHRRALLFKFYLVNKAHCKIFKETRNCRWGALVFSIGKLGVLK